MEILNEYKSTKNGFTHVSKLYRNNALVCEARCHYLNRTWESYTFQSSMKKVISMAIEKEIAEQKRFQGIKRLTKALRQDIINYSSWINELTTKYKSL
jgi:7,8-dihydro-6-hydroxymethylpterin-pyrophosphokinase